MLCLLRRRYPIWLTENKSKISAEQYTNYTNQFELMKKMCGGVNMLSLTALMTLAPPRRATACAS